MPKNHNCFNYPTIILKVFPYLDDYIHLIKFMTMILMNFKY